MKLWLKFASDIMEVAIMIAVAVLLLSGLFYPEEASRSWSLAAAIAAVKAWKT